MKAVRTTVAMAAAVAAVNLAAMAADAEGWRFEITPYAWLQGVDGTLSINDRDFDFDHEFSDLWDSVDFGASLLGVARYDRWVALGQFDYVSLDTDNADDSRPASIEIDQMFAVAAAGYECIFGDRFEMDVMAGVRYGGLDNTVTVKPVGRDESKDVESTDAVLLLRPRVKLLGNLQFNPLMAVGAGDSDLVYELQPEFQYFFNSTIDMRIGYRYLHYEVEDGNAELDLNFSGVLVGLGFNI